MKLTDEHIVPYSLGGSHVLRKASCLRCADITKKFEQRVARDMWGDARIAFDAPSRRKRLRKRHIKMRDPHDRTRIMKVPAQEYPAALIFYKMCQAGLLQGFPATVDLSKGWQLVAIDDDKRRESFHEKYPGKLVVKFYHAPEEFGRILAKVGYCQVLTTLDVGDFRPICLPYILGEKSNVSYVVGGTFQDQQPEPNNGYSLKTVGFGSSNRLMLIALVRLYANTHAPAYHVVVGDVTGTAEVERVVQKIGGAVVESDWTLSSSSKRAPHWLPREFPLPFWAADAGDS